MVPDWHDFGNSITITLIKDAITNSLNRRNKQFGLCAFTIMRCILPLLNYAQKQINRTRLFINFCIGN